MIFANKKVGETPLQFLDRIREEVPDLKNEKLSYAGRLDPMAEGEMLIIVGEENKEREKYLGFNKEYVATFLAGVSTDTGDLLGKINKKSNIIALNANDLKNSIEKISKISEQKYPWFSGKTVCGKKLFEYFRSGNLNIERPIQKISIKKAELISIRSESVSLISEYFFSSISKVKGDFRQNEIILDWHNYFDFLGSENVALPIFDVNFVVSSGTFIRALTEEFDFPTTLLKLNRTKIIL